jgi:hypothetical protein
LVGAIEREHQIRQLSIKYQIAIAKLPLAKDIDDFVFDDASVNEALARDLAGGGFLAHQRNVVLVGDSGPARPMSRSRLGSPLANAASPRSSSPPMRSRHS